jgi:hypothetical protein
VEVHYKNILTNYKKTIMEAIVVITVLTVIAVIALTVIKSGKKNQEDSNPGGIDSPGEIEPLDPNVKPE